MRSRRCWSLLIGSRAMRASRGVFPPADDRRLQEITTRHFPTGYTILHAVGGWFDPRRRAIVREESRQVLITAASLGAVTRWAQELGAALNQAELLIVEVGRAVPFKVQASVTSGARPRGGRRGRRG